MMQQFYSNGKLLLSGEYLVLDGALSLAVPTVFGQYLKVTPITSPKMIWKSRDEHNAIWFEVDFNLYDLINAPERVGLENPSSEKFKIATTLLHILSQALKLNPVFLNIHTGFEVETKLTFPRNWGLGTSSTLINNIAQWAKVNPYELLWKTVGGSGYDIACAKHNRPLLYILNHGVPTVEEISFNPPFKNQIYFIYLNKKQNSAAGILNYRTLLFDKPKAIEQISTLTKEMASCVDISYFKELIVSHERVLSQILLEKPVKESLFPDYSGAVKSLGAWGGDFIMAVGNEATPTYFKSKGFTTVLEYGKMVR